LTMKNCQTRPNSGMNISQTIPGRSSIGILNPEPRTSLFSAYLKWEL
jgi:hypothetical protein